MTTGSAITVIVASFMMAMVVELMVHISLEGGKIETKFSGAGIGVKI